MMKASEEIEALVNTYAYAKCKEVYEYCDKEYRNLYEEHKKTLEEIKHLKMHNTRLKNKLKGAKGSTTNYNYLEQECERYRELCKKYIKERDMYKKMYKYAKEK